MVKTPGDVYEQEADQTAATVMQMPGQTHAQIRRVQASDTGETSVPPIVHEVMRTPGQPLDEGARHFMESRFGHDFSRVRVHTDEDATRSAQAVGALAYTVGPHVVFQKSRFNPDTREGKELLAHELAHVVQQGATPTREAMDSSPVLQKQDDETSPPAEPPTPEPETTGTSESAPVSGPEADPSSNWTPDVPYIWFDLHDFFKALAEPEGPYLYSSYVRRNRIDNPNFSNNIDPGPVRDTTTRLPSGWRAERSDLWWFFYTKFFVDSADAPLPARFTRFETSADIRFAPTGGGEGFEDHFADNNPRYLSPGGLSYPFALSTTPYGFRAQHTIMQPGVLQWDARLRVSMANTDIPIRIEYTAPPQFPDETAFRAAITGRGLRLRDADPGEPVPTYRLTFSSSGPDVQTAILEVISEQGLPEGERRLENVQASPSAMVEVMALIATLSLDPNWSEGQFGTSSERHVEIAGSQRVRFERPTS